MKQYAIYETKKARGDQGNCIVCSQPIKEGEPFKYAETTPGNRIPFCTGCEVNQSLIGKNVGEARVQTQLKVATEKMQEPELEMAKLELYRRVAAPMDYRWSTRIYEDMKKDR